jgi:hypothetical protein
MPAVAENFEKYCDADTSDENRVAFEIANSDSRGAMFSAFGGVEGC